MRRYDLVPKARGRDGWFGGRPCGIARDAWPRSRNNGLPMVHVATIRLPDEYRRDERFEAVSIFEALDFETDDIDGASEILEGRPLTPEESKDPYLRSLAVAAANRHPEERFYVDDTVGDLVGFAVIWLTPAEFAAKPTSPPKKILHDDLEDAPSAWDSGSPKVAIAHVPVEDPNAGKPYQSTSTKGSGSGYVPLCELPEETQSRLQNATHFGGTLSDPANVDLPTLSPYVLEVGEVGPANLPRGNFYVDLDSRTMFLGR